MLLVMKVSPERLPKHQDFKYVKPITDAELRSKLGKRFTGEEFIQTAALQGVKLRSTRDGGGVNLADDEEDERGEAEEGGDDCFDDIVDDA
jgi:hypothetical protein